MQGASKKTSGRSLFFKGAPLRATSSADDCSTRFANLNYLKIQRARAIGNPSRNCQR